jgi:hypothetical protein
LQKKVTLVCQNSNRTITFSLSSVKSFEILLFSLEVFNVTYEKQEGEDEDLEKAVNLTFTAFMTNWVY